MKKLNITKEKFNSSRYFQNKYGKLKYVSESGNVYKTSKGQLIKFVKESESDDISDESQDIYQVLNSLSRYYSPKQLEEKLGDSVENVRCIKGGNTGYTYEYLSGSEEDVFFDIYEITTHDAIIIFEFEYGCHTEDIYDIRNIRMRHK